MIRKRVSTAVAVCRDCGEVRVPIADVTLVLLDGIMTYDCPVCGRSVERPSPVNAEQALLGAGVRLVLQ